MQNSAEILFEKFEVIACLKKDSHNAVYTANHIYLGKKIILKTLNTSELPDKVVPERFKREARILALMDHPNLIKILDFGTYGNHLYISSEYFESRNLRQMITMNTLTYDQKHHLFVQLLKALNVAHQNNIVHRDVKPENILVNTNYELKIADFGLAIVLNDNALTNKASIVGTPGYMSPEQIKGDTLSVQSDIFSAGIVALELFTGENPFIGKNINETINNILGFSEAKITELVKNISPAVQQSIKLMLKKNTSDRAKNANEVLNLLGVAEEFFTPVEMRIKKRIKSKTILVSSSLFTIFLTFFMVYLFSFEEPATRYSFGNNELMQIDQPDYKSNQTETTPDSSLTILAKDNVTKQMGRLFVEVVPWADIYINEKKINTTPIQDYINLPTGTYKIKLIHPDYPVYSRRIVIGTEKIENINVNFKELAGFLNCKIYPWGEIYINNEFKSQTPLRQPIVLLPGSYKLTIKNPQYGSVSETITIKSKDIYEFQFNFENTKL